MAEENGGVARSHGKFITLKQEGNIKGNIPTKDEINIISDCQSGYMAGIRRLKLKQSWCGVGAVCCQISLIRHSNHSFKRRDQSRMEQPRVKDRVREIVPESERRFR
jgi:hypothetical protein